MAFRRLAWRSIHINTKLTGLREWIFGGKSKVDNVIQTDVPTTPTAQSTCIDSARELKRTEIQNHLQGWAESVSTDHEPVQWTDIRIPNTDVKTKILLSCEAVFNRSIPNRSLSTINTFGDLMKFYDTPSKQPPGALFPNIRENLSALPSNLSVEFPPKWKPKAERKPFQNFNDLSHETFPNKKKRKYHRF